MSKPVGLPAGQKTALGAYLEQLAPRLRKLAGHYARCTGLDRDDLLQEAFCGLVQAWQILDERIGEPRQFLIRHARWHVLTYARRSRYRRMDRLPHALIIEDAELSAADLHVDVAEARLSPVQRHIVRCLVSGMTWRETGEALRCSSANIAYHVRQIRRRIDAP